MAQKNAPFLYVTVNSKPSKSHYGFFTFLLDCAMVCLTSGLWFIWIFVREMRKR